MDGGGKTRSPWTRTWSSIQGVEIVEAVMHSPHRQPVLLQSFLGALHRRMIRLASSLHGLW